jgi:hypothetical protein
MGFYQFLSIINDPTLEFNSIDRIDNDCGSGVTEASLIRLLYI